MLPDHSPTSAGCSVREISYQECSISIPRPALKASP